MASATVAFNSPSQPTDSSRRSLNNSQSGTVRPMPLYGRRTSSLPTSPKLNGPTSHHREQYSFPTVQRSQTKAATTENISTIGDRPGNNNNRMTTPMSFNRDQQFRGGAHTKIAISRTPHHIVHSRQMPADETASAWAEDEPNFFTPRRDRLPTTSNDARCENKMTKSQSEQGRKPRADKRRAPVAGITLKDSHHLVLSAPEFPLCTSCSKHKVSEEGRVVRDENSADTKTQSMSSVRQQATNSANALRHLLGEREIKSGREISPTSDVFGSPSNVQQAQRGAEHSQQRGATPKNGNESKPKRKRSGMITDDVDETSSQRAALESDLGARKGGEEYVVTGARKTSFSSHERSESEHLTPRNLHEATNKSPPQPPDARPASSTIGRFDCTNCEIGYCDSIYHRPAVIDPSFNDVNKRGSQNSLKTSLLQSDNITGDHPVDVGPSNYRAVQITKVSRASDAEQKRKDKSPASYQPAKKYSRTSETSNKDTSPNCPTLATDEAGTVNITGLDSPPTKTSWARTNRKMKPLVPNHLVSKASKPSSPEKPKDQGSGGFSIRKSSVDPWLQKKVAAAASPKVVRPLTASKLSRYVSPAETAKMNYQLRKNYQPPLPQSVPPSVKSKAQDAQKPEVRTPRFALSRLTYTNSVDSNTSFQSASSPPTKASVTCSELDNPKNLSEWHPSSARLNVCATKLSRIPGPLDSPRAPLTLKHESGNSSFRPISPVLVSDTPSDKTRISRLVKPTTHRYRAPSPTDTINGSECDSSVLGRQIWMLTGGDETENDRGKLADSSRRFKSKPCSMDTRIKPDIGSVHNINSANSRIPLSSARTPRLNIKNISKLPMPKFLTDISSPEGCLCSPRIRNMSSGVNGPTTHQMVRIEPPDPVSCEFSSDKNASQKGISRMQQKLSAQEQAAKIRQRIYDQELAARKNPEQDQEIGVVKNLERATIDQDERSLKQNLDPEFLLREKQKHFAQEQAGKMRQRIFDQEQAATLRREEALNKQQTQTNLAKNVVAESKLNAAPNIQDLSFELAEISQREDQRLKLVTNDVVSGPIPAPRTYKNLVLKVASTVQPETDFSVVAKGIQYEIPCEKQASKISSPRSHIKERMAVKRMKNLVVDRSKKLSPEITMHEEPIETSTVSLASTANAESMRRSNRISKDERSTRIPSRSPSADRINTESTRRSNKISNNERLTRIPSRSPSADRTNTELTRRSDRISNDERPTRIPSRSPSADRTNTESTKRSNRIPKSERPTRIPSRSPSADRINTESTKRSNKISNNERPTRIPSRSPSADRTNTELTRRSDRISNDERPTRIPSRSPNANTESTRRSNTFANDERPTRIPSRSPSADRTMPIARKRIALERSRIIPLKTGNADEDHTRIPNRSPDYELKTRISSLSPGGERSKRIANTCTNRPTRIENANSDHTGSIVEGHSRENLAGSSRSMAVSSTRIASTTPSHRNPLIGILSNTSQSSVRSSVHMRSASRSPISFRTKPKTVEIDQSTATLADAKYTPSMLLEPERLLSSTKTDSAHDVTSSSLIVIVNRPQSTSSAYIPSFITVVASNSVSSKVGFGVRRRFFSTGGSEQGSWVTRRIINSDPSVSIGARSTSSDDQNPVVQVIARPVDANCYIPAFFKVAQHSPTVPRKFGDMKSLERMFIATAHENDPKDRFQMFTKGHWTEATPLNQSCTSPTSGTGSAFSFYCNEAGTQTEDNRYASCLSASRLITTESDLLGTQKTTHNAREDSGTIGASVMQIWSKNREVPINLSGDNRDSNATWSKRLLTKTLYFKTDAAAKEKTNEEQKLVKSSHAKKPDFSLKNKSELTLSNILLERKRAGLATMTSVGELMADFVARKNRSMTDHHRSSENNEASNKRVENKSNVNNVQQQQQHVEYKMTPAVVRDTTKTVQFSLKKHSKGGGSAATFKGCAVQKADDGEDRVRIVTLGRKDRFSRPRDNQPWTNKNDN